mgnify:CR=1 FL=1
MINKITNNSQNNKNINGIQTTMQQQTTSLTKIFFKVTKIKGKCSIQL